MPPKPKLTPDEILTSEFDYIAATATQANEDRAKVATFYFVSVGSLLVAIFSTQLFDPEQNGEILEKMYLAFALLFGFLVILGYLTIAQLARLRTAWMESVMAMNQIKEYYVKHIGEDLKQAFRWTNEKAPKGYKPGSVANYLAQQVAILSGLIFGAAAYFFQLGIGYTRCLWPFTLSLGMFMALFQLYWYKKMVTEDPNVA